MCCILIRFLLDLVYFCHQEKAYLLTVAADESLRQDIRTKSQGD